MTFFIDSIEVLGGFMETLQVLKNIGQRNNGDVEHQLPYAYPQIFCNRAEKVTATGHNKACTTGNGTAGNHNPPCIMYFFHLLLLLFFLIL